MSIKEKRDQLVEELIPFEDHLERFAYIIERAKDALSSIRNTKSILF